MEECVKCNMRFILWINWGTLVTETDNEYMLCDYCKTTFEEENKTHTPIELLELSEGDVTLIKQWAETIEKYIKMRKACDKIDKQLKERNIII